MKSELIGSQVCSKREADDPPVCLSYDEYRAFLYDKFRKALQKIQPSKVAIPVLVWGVWRAFADKQQLSVSPQCTRCTSAVNRPGIYL